MSDAIEYCPTCETNVACHMARACQSAVAHCAVANGWVPVSSAEALATEWEDKAKGYMATAPAAASPSHRERIEAVSDTLWHCARQLRRQVVNSDERQPAPNNAMSHERSELAP